MFINDLTGNTISSEYSTDSQILDLKTIVKIKNEEIKRFNLLDELRKQEMDNFNNLFLTGLNIPKSLSRNIEESNNDNNDSFYSLRKLETERYESPDSRNKINIQDYNELLAPAKKDLFTEIPKNLKISEDINCFKSIQISPNKNIYKKLDVYKIKNSIKRKKY